MPHGPGRSTYTFRSDSPLWVRSFLERVAEALARAASDHAVLVERSARERFPRVTSRRPEFDATIRAVAGTMPGSLREAPPGVDLAPSGLGEGWTGFLIARARGPTPATRRSEPVEAAATTLPFAAAILDGAASRELLGLPLQSHWFPDPSGRIRAW
ncbi:MAG: hypothetical protein L3K06_09075, partial [Thermoplasmata archaeon]|nr:hypothetical protein [Thermoplasmata archaeon]